MFTGIVQQQGSLASRESFGGDARLIVDVPSGPADGAGTGDSVAVNGVCLTVAERRGGRLVFDVSAETLSKTRFGDLEAGARLNLEPALAASDPVGGHFVTGHVDGVGEVRRIEPDARSHRLEVEAPESLARYIAVKGCITVDGVSLTVNGVDGARFDFNVVPHTWAATNIRDYTPGTLVHIEVDIIARYLERLIGDRGTAPGLAPGPAGAADEGITTDFLSKQGFASPAGDGDEDELESRRDARPDPE